MRNTLKSGQLLLCLAALVLCAGQEARAAQLEVTPQGAQPGDVLTITAIPRPGESISAVQMAAFDTSSVKFYPRRDGSFRAFLGFPFDRHAGSYSLRARVFFSGALEGQSEPISAAFVAKNRVYPTQWITMKPSTAKRMSDHAAFRREKQFVQQAMAHSNPFPLWQPVWIVPARGLSTSSYGRRRFVNGHPWGQHNGADIRAATGTPVLASNSGRVVLSAYLPTLRGNCVVIDHGCNIFSVYMHLSRRLVSAGDSVTEGQEIGRVGATGFVTGPHLHWEIRIGWEPVDPFHVVEHGLWF